MEGISKKLSIWTVLTVYAISFMINSTFFVDRGKVAASGSDNLTKIVAVIVDKDLYPSIQSDVERYTTSYIQARQADTKAIVLPINIKNISAPDIVKILENIYFDGIQDVPSKLAGIVLIGNIPLPVVQDNGFVYPSIYPYVDFEEQQFIYDQTKNFFVPNDNPNGQAEIRHGIINFTGAAQYTKYFQKLKNYNSDPQSFIDTQIWYDDFIGNKKYFIAENTNFYINKQIFAEDIGYHRVNNLLFNTLKGEYNASAGALGATLQSDLADTEDQNLKNYADMIKEKQDIAGPSLQAMSGSKTPTMVLSKSINELTKTYDGLISTKLLTKREDNVQAAARRYTQDLSGNRVDNVSSHYEKIVQRDNRIIGAQPLLIQMNNALESGLNQKITQEKYAMKIPLPITYENVDYYNLIYTKYSYYQNFYFGKLASSISDLNDLSIYRGTFQNLDTLTGTTVTSPEKSVGGSYHFLSQQVEANRGYNLLNTEGELAFRSGSKQYLLHEKTCTGGFGFIPYTEMCLGTVGRNTTYGEDNDFTDVKGDNVAKETKESPADFAIRLRGGASPINLDTEVLQNRNSYLLSAYNFRHAIAPIYDIAGGQKTTVITSGKNTNSYLAIQTYGSLIKTKDQAGSIYYPRAIATVSGTHDKAILINNRPFVLKETIPAVNMDFLTIFQANNEWTNTVGPLITLKRVSAANGSGYSDYRVHTYKLIDSTQKNISPTPAEVTGMNITTADRPIDNIRNITFQGIGGDVVQFNYPNIYEVSVYKTVGNMLVLKTETEILNALKVYLQNKVTEYNNALTAQQNKKDQYYQSHTLAFNFLSQGDLAATPNRNYALLPQDFLIQQLVSNLDNLVASYGNAYVYGDMTPISNDEKLSLVAKLLLYQNSNWTERKKASTVADDIANIKDSFNINKKISDTTNIYLQSKHNEGAFVSPTYNRTGYEVAYINSDGFDLVDNSETPAFIKQLQNTKALKEEQANTANKILQEKSPTESEIDAECGVDTNGAALLFDIKTGKSPWMAAMKCWAKNIFKIKISVSFKSALGPTVPGTLQDIGESFTSVASQRSNYGAAVQQKDEADNAKALQNPSPAIAARLKEFVDVTDVQASASSRFVDSNEPHELTINSFRVLEKTQVTITATGEVCLGLQADSKILSNNLCTKPVNFALDKDASIYNLIDSNNTRKAGSMVITTKFCIGGSTTNCIAKSKTITTLPAAIKKITTQATTPIVMMGASVPIRITAQDAYQNAIDQVIENYTITPQTGTINGVKAMDFNNFSKATFLYQAPEKVTENTPITINISGKNQDGLLVTGVQKLIIAKGILNVNYVGQIVYSTNISQARTIGYQLPATASGLVQKDINNIAQVQSTAIPKLTLTLQDKNGNKLDSVANIVSRYGLLMPGKLQQNGLTISGHKLLQTVFQAQGNIIIKDGTADIRLYPSLKAGAEEIVINVPGLDPIRIVINVHPGTASKVTIQLDNNSLSLRNGSDTSSGTIQVLDNRNNIVKEPTNLKIGALGPGLINNVSSTDITRNGSPISFVVKGKQPGGAGHLFAYLRDIAIDQQEPAEQSFFVQNNVLPATGLNVMYLNLFGTDRGNQRGYFSDNNQKVNQLTETSDKLLATTTSLIDPTKIKQMTAIIAPDGQIQNLGEEVNSLNIMSGQVIVELPTIGTVNYGPSKLFTILSVTSDELSSRSKNQNTILYIAEQTDSVISGNSLTDNKVFINGKSVIDFTAGTMATSIRVEANAETSNGLTLYDVLRNDTKIATLAVYKKTALISNTDIKVSDSIKYAKENTFTQSSTNAAMGIGIYDTQSSYSKVGYQSIEDSTDPLAGIGFTSKFKNISYFAAGKTVGQATIPYGSAFLINFGDPLVQRVSENIKISKTEFDGSAGQEVFTNPNKTIFKTIPTDFNHDGLIDLLIAYTDGSVQLLKNYGGKDPFKNLENMMIIGDTIKEIHVGDVNGDEYPDILLWTNADKLLVYQNRKGIMDVDGTPVCLNTNVQPDEVTSMPNDISGVHQLFIEDMDQDNNLDIITNDVQGDVKIFYGGKDSHGNGLYLSTLTGVCDDKRFARQQHNYQTVKSFGLKINPDRYITDDSLVHRKDMPLPNESLADDENPENDLSINLPAVKEDGSNFTSGDAAAVSQQFVKDTAKYTVIGAKDLSYVDNPLDKVPSYESLPKEQIKYLPISKLSGDTVSIYKQYEDLNGGILKEGDQVRIIIHILSLANNNKITYLEQLKGPREIKKNTENKIISRTLTGNQTTNTQTHRDVGPDYQVMVDNIVLQTNQSVEMSYIVNYQKPALTKIKVEDKDLSSLNKPSDGYPDIIVQTSDPCIKTQRISRNTKDHGQGYKEYQDVVKDLDKTMSDYSSGARTTQENQLDSSFTQVTSTTAQTIASLPGVSDILETWDIKDVFSEGGGLNINLNTDFIDKATAGVKKQIDGVLKGLCGGFKLGSEGCQGIPVPFNQAFLAPGQYHIFGCVPKFFAALNSTLGKGLPLLAFPTDSTIPIWPPSPSGAGAIFGGTTSQFRLYIAPTMTLGLGIAICVGPYSLGVKLPKPFRDIAGNCTVFAIPGAMLPCNPDGSVNDTATTKGADEVDPDLVSDNGSCENPPIIGNKIVFASSNNSIETSPKGTSSPLQAVDIQGSVSSPLVPQGNFGGLVQINQEPIITTTTEAQNAETSSPKDITLTPGEKINLKILGGKTKGLIKCIVQDWMTRQLKFIINNITKMTIQVNLPDMRQMVQGFDKIGNFSEIIKSLNADDAAAGYTTTQTKITSSNALTGLKAKFSRQQWSSISNKIGQNPFEAVAMMFKDVPLINLSTKDISLKIPMITSEDIVKYGSYLKSWIAKNSQIIEDRSKLFNQVLAFCGTTSKADAQKMKTELEAQVKTIDDKNIKKILESEIKDMDNILKLPQETTRQQLGSDRANIGINIANTAKKVATLPAWKSLQVFYGAKKAKEGTNFQDQAILAVATAQTQTITKCASVALSVDGFIGFKTDSEKLITSVQENIKVLEQYKKYPGQLYEWIHVVDRYLGEIGAITSEFVGGLTTWLDTNANRFSQYVDAITLIIGAIKTWQAIINFSINRSEKCSKCSNDNYGSFSCSLSFLCPQLPIFKIPSFKIPDITLDLSHVEVGLDILLPKFTFVPIKIPLPEFPSLPEPPNFEVSLSSLNALEKLNINLFKEMQIPSIPVLPGPPQLPELPSFIPNIELKLPVLPPAPKIPKILPEINAVLKVADFIGNIFCIVKGGIGLVGEKGVKAKIEQLTQRKWNVPVFDFFDLTSKYKDPPLEGFDYTIDAYVRLKYNFEGVYTLLDGIAQTANQFVTATIEAPMQEGMQKINSQMNNNSGIETLQQVESAGININGFIPTNATGLEYADAYQQLQAGLHTFSQQAGQDKQILSQIDTIKRTINADTTVKPASKQIQQAKSIADDIVNTKQKEVSNIADQVKDYDTFITDVQKNQIQLVSQKDDLTTTISTPLITMNETTKQMIASQEAPNKTYLTLNKTLVQGYQKALEGSSAADLNMTTDVYNKSSKYLSELSQKIDTAETISNQQEPAKTEKLLLATDGCIGGSCQTNTMLENGYQQDMTSYVQGILVQTGNGSTGTTQTMVNVVNNQIISSDIGKNYLQLDINNDEAKDMLLRDTNTVYIKYAKQDNEYLTAGGNSTETIYTKYFAYQNGNKWRLDSLTDAVANTDNGYATFGNIKVKICDTYSEVKNFKTEGQSFDTLQMTRKNSTMMGEEISGYIIKIDYQVNSFFEKLKTFNFFGSETTPTKYILILPTDTKYATGLLSVERIQKEPIKTLLSGDVRAVKYFDPDADKISITITDVPSKWMYAQIAPLKQDQAQLTNAQRKNLTLFAQGGPRSNQIVAGKQILADTEGPVGTVVFQRVLTNEIISTGNAHEGWINTNYTLKAHREDMVAVTRMTIEHKGQTIYSKTGTAITGSVEIPNLFFTGAMEDTYTFKAVDANNNISKEVVTFKIAIPEITITDVKKIDEQNSEIIAQLENDIDEGLVTFQRDRNGLIKAITGTTANSLGGYTLSPNQKIITGGIMQFGNTLGLYTPSGEEIGSINPDNGEIIILDAWKDKISLQLDFLLHIPTIKVMQKSNQQELFQISLPTQKMQGITMKQGKPAYQVIALTQGQFQDFQDGSCIQNANKECIIYVNSLGKIYIPNVYSSILGGSYSFDSKNKTILYTITDEKSKAIAIISLQMKPLFQ